MTNDIQQIQPKDVASVPPILALAKGLPGPVSRSEMHFYAHMNGDIIESISQWHPETPVDPALGLIDITSIKPEPMVGDRLVDGKIVAKVQSLDEAKQAALDAAWIDLKNAAYSGIDNFSHETLSLIATHPNSNTYDIVVPNNDRNPVSLTPEQVVDLGKRYAAQIYAAYQTYADKYNKIKSAKSITALNK